MGDDDNKTTPASDKKPGGDDLTDALSELRKEIADVAKLDWRGEKKKDTDGK